MKPWEEALPPELRNIILEYVRASIHLPPVYVGIPSPRQSHPACLSSVNRQWRNFFSPHIDIVVNQHSLNDFRSDFRDEQRRARVRRICLHVKLPKYECTGHRCMWQESHAVRTRNDTISLSTLWRFMEIMSNWRTTGRWDSGIELDIGAYSPSDVRHYLLINEVDTSPIPEASSSTDAVCPALPGMLSSYLRWEIHPAGLVSRLYARIGDSFPLGTGLGTFPFTAPVFDSLTIRSR